jgi:hypothetical protein
VVRLLRILEKTLREYHMFRFLRKAFITIELAQFKELFGFNETNASVWTDAAVTAFITKRGLNIEGSYVHIPSRIRGIDDSESGGAKKFHLGEERIHDLT